MFSRHFRPNPPESSQSSRADWHLFRVRCALFPSPLENSQIFQPGYFSGLLLEKWIPNRMRYHRLTFTLLSTAASCACDAESFKYPFVPIAPEHRLLGNGFIVDERIRLGNANQLVEASSKFHNLASGSTHALWPPDHKLKTVTRLKLMSPRKYPSCNLTDIPPNKRHVCFPRLGRQRNPKRVPKAPVKVRLKITALKA
jgi:hypothetical protein